MLTADVRFEGWGVDDWLRLLALFRPAPAPAAIPRQAPERSPGGVVVVHDGGRVRKLLHTRVGRLELAGEKWPAPLDELAARHHAAWAVAVHTGALEEVMERFGARARRGDDLVAQALTVAQIVREMMQEGAIQAWPRRGFPVPLPSPQVVSRTLASICPDGRVVAIGVFDGGELYTSLAVRRRGNGFDLILGPDELRSAMGLLSGEWRRDYRHLARVLEERAGPLSVGLFTEVGILRKLLAERAPGAFARAVAVRDVVLSPVTLAVAVPVGLDAARGAVSTARNVAERFDRTGLVAPVLSWAGIAEREGEREAEREPPRGAGGLLELLRRLGEPR